VTVYVDDMSNYPLGQFRRMKMSHMIATTEGELHAMAQKIGVRRHWYQGDHYDVCLSMKKEALANGAVLISMRQLAAMSRLQKMGLDMGDPATAEARMVAAKEARRKT
jgi:hypothetical protein